MPAQGISSMPAVLPNKDGFSHIKNNRSIKLRRCFAPMKAVDAPFARTGNAYVIVRFDAVAMQSSTYGKRSLTNNDDLWVSRRLCLLFI